MTKQTREALRGAGHFIPWVLLFALLGYMASIQNAYNENATVERNQRIAYTDSIDRLDGALVVTDSKGKIREWNAGMTELFGYSREEVLGRTVEFILPTDMRAYHRLHMLESLSRPLYGVVQEITCPEAITKAGDRIAVVVRVRVEKRLDEPVAIANFNLASRVNRVDMASRR